MLFAFPLFRLLLPLPLLFRCTRRVVGAPWLRDESNVIRKFERKLCPRITAHCRAGKFEPVDHRYLTRHGFCLGNSFKRPQVQILYSSGAQQRMSGTHTALVNDSIICDGTSEFYSALDGSHAGQHRVFRESDEALDLPCVLRKAATRDEEDCNSREAHQPIL